MNRSNTSARLIGGGALQRNTVWAVGMGGALVAIPSNPISDYSNTGVEVPGDTDWSTGASTFGACLRTVGGGATTDASTWSQNASCTTSDAVGWRAIPATSASGATVARTAVAGSAAATVTMQFGVRTASSQQAGLYLAPLVFEVVAPGI